MCSRFQLNHSATHSLGGLREVVAICFNPLFERILPAYASARATQIVEEFDAAFPATPIGRGCRHRSADHQKAQQP
jgi:hypothetical protein